MIGVGGYIPHPPLNLYWQGSIPVHAAIPFSAEIKGGVVWRMLLPV